MTRLWGTYQLLLALLVALVALGGNTLVHKDTDKVLWELKNVSSSSGNVKQIGRSTRLNSSHQI